MSRAKTTVKRNSSASDRENTQSDGVKTGNESPVVNHSAIPQENQDSCRASHGQVAPVIQCRRWCVTENYVPHNSPAEPSRYRKDEEPEEIHLLPNSEDSPTEADRKSYHQFI